jgi:excisionase family DNA binding protein
MEKPLEDLLRKIFTPVIESCVRNAIEPFLAQLKGKQEEKYTYISASQAAAIIGVSRPTLLKYTRSGEITGYRLNRMVKYRKEEIEKCLKTIKTIKHSRTNNYE